MPALLSTLRNHEVSYNGKAVTKRKREASPITMKNVRKKMMEMERNRDKNKRYRESKARIEKQAKTNNKTRYLNNKEKEKVIQEFEERTKSLSHKQCNSCHTVGISLEMSREDNVCKHCKTNNLTKQRCLEERLLPVWYDTIDDARACRHAHFDLPSELIDLTDAEKMLIQKYSIYVPLHHIKKGTMGYKGHVCCFPQQLESVCNILPRLPKDVSIVKLLRTYKDSSGIGKTRLLSVRKDKVLKALKWLKIHSLEYKDIVIEETNLDWMGNQTETELPPTIDYIESSEVRIS